MLAQRNPTFPVQYRRAVVPGGIFFFTPFFHSFDFGIDANLKKSDTSGSDHAMSGYAALTRPTAYCRGNDSANHNSVKAILELVAPGP